MVDLNLSSFCARVESHNFIEYEMRLASYLKTFPTNEFRARQINGIKLMVSLMDMSKEENVFQLAFLMWWLVDKFVDILHDGFLLQIFDLDQAIKLIIESPPQLIIHGRRMDMFKPRPTMNISISLYNCIKFIGQFTNDQDVYTKCCHLLKQMPKKLEGPIMDPGQILYLMKYNLYVDTSSNVTQGQPHFDKIHDFYQSIFGPDSHLAISEDKFIKDIQSAYYLQALQSRGVKTQETHGQIDYVVLADQIVKSNSWLPLTTHCINSRLLCDIDPGTIKNIESILLEIGKSPISEQKEHLFDSKIAQTLRFIDENDDVVMNSIANQALVYVKDKPQKIKDLDIKYKHDLLCELYNKKIADPNCKFSHNLMRNAVKDGRIWLVKFLVSHGVATKNLPCYGRWKQDLESKQLIDIVSEPYKDYHGFGEEYSAKKQTERDKMREYLLVNNYI